MSKQQQEKSASKCLDPPPPLQTETDFSWDGFPYTHGQKRNRRNSYYVIAITLELCNRRDYNYVIAEIPII